MANVQNFQNVQNVQNFQDVQDVVGQDVGLATTATVVTTATIHVVTTISAVYEGMGEQFPNDNVMLGRSGWAGSQKYGPGGLVRGHANDSE